jgi:hypothetical protein
MSAQMAKRLVGMERDLVAVRRLSEHEFERLLFLIRYEEALSEWITRPLLGDFDAAEPRRPGE